MEHLWSRADETGGNRSQRGLSPDRSFARSQESNGPARQLVDESIDGRAFARRRRKERPDQLPPAHDLLSRPGSERDDRRGQADATENQTGSRAEAEPEPSDPDRGAGHASTTNPETGRFVAKQCTT